MRCSAPTNAFTFARTARRRRADPIADNTEPTSAAELPGAGVDFQKVGNAHAASLLQKAMDAIYRAAGFGGTAGATAAIHEANAIADLRQLKAAEGVFLTMFARRAAVNANLLAPRTSPANGYLAVRFI